MAIDRNALDAITGERKGKKNQSRFEDRPKAPSQSPRQQLGLVDYSAFDIGKYKPYSKPAAPVTVEPRGFKETPVTVERPEPTKGPYTGVMTRGVQGQGVGQVGVGGSMSIPPALAGDRAALAAAERMRSTQSPRPPQEVQQAQPASQPAMNDVRMAEQNSEPIRPRGLFSRLAGTANSPLLQLNDTKKSPTATDKTQNFKVIPLTEQERKQMADEVLADEAQRVRQVTREDEAMAFARRAGRPEQSPRPFQTQEPMPMPTIGQTTTTAQSPTVEPLTPSYVQSDSANKRDALRAQIAAEQQRMLMARRQTEGARRRGVEIEPFNEGASLKKIAEMRSELAGYEKAAMPVQQIKVKTAEQNLATEQDVARQAADIMQRDVEDLRNQLSTMPEGQTKAAMQERLRSLEYQQQQQSARGRVLAPAEVGPQVRGASPELYQQMLQEGEARTQRQREAAPRVAARQEALGEAAYRAAEGQQAGRLQAQQRQADFESAIQKARISEIGAPEQERELKRQAIEAGISESKAKTEAIRTEAASKAAESALRLESGNLDLAAKRYNLEMQKKFGEPMQRLAIRKAELDQEMAEQGMQFNPELQARKNQFAEEAMKTAGVTPGKYELALKAANDIKSQTSAFNDKTFVGSFWTGSASGATEASKHITNYIESLKTLSTVDPESAKRLAGDLIAAMPEFEQASGVLQSGMWNMQGRKDLVVRLKAANETLRELTQ